MENFKLWLEFEEVDFGVWDNANDFCNIHVYLPDGRKYGINVWTYKFFQASIEKDKASGNCLKGLYQTPPDLFVEELSRDILERVIADLLIEGDLEVVLNPSVSSNKDPV